MALRSTLFVASTLVAAAIIAGCYTGSAVDTNRQPETPTTSTDGTAPLKAGSNVHGLTHLPCDVEQLLSDACWQCHGTVPGYGASTTLVTYDDLSKPTIIGGNEADLMLLRMKATENTMPPDNPPTSDQLATLQNWITAGYPVGHCGEDTDAGTEAGVTTGDDDDAGDPTQAPSVCTSGTTIDPTKTGSTMKPGNACLSCHNADAQTVLQAGGTVYPTLNEPDDCAGASGLKVLLLDANGTTHTMTTNSSGNFYTPNDIPGPFKAIVVNGAATREMKTLLTNGDCNACHTASPTAGMPGRIIGP